MSSKTVCEACAVYLSDCLTPVGDGAADLCWLCAHMVTHHAMAVGPIPEQFVCSCTRDVIYPDAYRTTLDERLAFIARGSYASAAAAMRAMAVAGDADLATFAHDSVQRYTRSEAVALGMRAARIARKLAGDETRQRKP